MRDDLIGFVLGALDPDEHDRISRKVEQDQEIQRQVERLECCLRPLSLLCNELEPPEGLARRTCQSLLVVAHDAGADEGGSNQDAGVASVALWSEAVARSQTESGPPVTPSRGLSAWGDDRSDGPMESRQWTTADLVVAAGVCLAMSCLFFPALINSRYNMQLSSCQHNMRDLGQSFEDYSRAAGGYFPVIPPAGNLSFSGVYAPKLAAKGLVHDTRVFQCPAKGNANTMVLRIPSLQEINGAKGPQLVSLYLKMGGDYAYALGYLRQGRLYGIRNDGRKNVAILADAPLADLRNSVITTHSRGQNVLFADGHVALLGTTRRPGSDGDDLFHNRHGSVRAGVDSEDFVLAPSHVSPLPVLGDDEVTVATRGR